MNSIHYHMDQQPITTDYVLADGLTIGLYGGTKLKNKEVKEIVGRALSHVPGVLGMKSSAADVLKAPNDLTRGVSIKISAKGEVAVSAKIIADYDVPGDAIIAQGTEAVRYALNKWAALYPDKLEISIAETVTTMEFFDRYGYERDFS